MINQIKRLRKFKNEPEKFFRIMWFLIRRSNVFRTSAINKTCPKWYKTYPLGKIMSLNRKINRLINTKSKKLDYTRIYIPKNENEMRPLGVPTLEWRILLQMVHNFLYIFLEDKFLDSQHGFLPGKGTLTAWQEIFGISQSLYIYEFDLKKFFDNVNSIKIG